MKKPRKSQAIQKMIWYKHSRADTDHENKAFIAFFDCFMWKVLTKEYKKSIVWIQREYTHVLYFYFSYMINQADIQELNEIGISNTEIFYGLIDTVKENEKKALRKILDVTPLLSTPLYE